MKNDHKKTTDTAPTNTEYECLRIKGVRQNITRKSL